MWRLTCLICNYREDDLVEMQEHIATEHFKEAPGIFWKRYDSIHRTPSFHEDPDGESDRYRWSYNGIPILEAVKM